MRRVVRRRPAPAVLTAIVALVAGSFGAIPATSAVASAPCSHPRVVFYPGDPRSSLRYGETVVSFDICWDKNPSEWRRSVSTTLNGTGATLGFSVQSESIRLVWEESNALTHVGLFEVQVGLKWCLPARVPPCSTPRLFAEVKAVDVGGAVAATLGRTWDNGQEVVIRRDS
jgi:hypothetical protein